MVLLRKLLGRELIELHHLLGKNAGCLESLGEQHNLGNHRIVRYHHGHWPEERL